MPKATVQQTEELACTQILEFAKTFYQDPKNVKAFEAWKKNKEEHNNGTDQSRSSVRPQQGDP